MMASKTEKFAAKRYNFLNFKTINAFLHRNILEEQTPGMLCQRFAPNLSTEIESVWLRKSMPSSRLD
jgi:hypothetical protein